MIPIGPHIRQASQDVVDLAFGRPLAPGVARNTDAYRADMRLAATTHGVGPLLGSRVVAGEALFDAELDAWLAVQTTRCRERLTLLGGQLRATLTALHAARIRCLPLKGAALLLRHGVDGLATRPMTDLDVLVEPMSERQLDLALAAADWRFTGAQWKHRSYLLFGPQPTPPRELGEHPDYPRGLEVHLRVVEQFRGYRWDITPQLLTDPDCAHGTPLPNANALALHLTVHASMTLLEGMARAIQLRDLAGAIAQADPDWLFAVVRAAGLPAHARFAYPALAVTARETGSAPCAALAERLRPWVTPAMAAWASTASLYDVSWLGLQDGPDLRRIGLWARNRRERARMLTYKLAPTPAALSGEKHAGGGPLVAQYARHYRHMVRRTIASARTARRALRDD